MLNYQSQSQRSRFGGLSGGYARLSHASPSDGQISHTTSGRRVLPPLRSLEDAVIPMGDFAGNSMAMS
jgi:hypothetical protein